MSLRPLVSSLKRAWHRARYGVEARFDLFDPVRIVPFRSWGTTATLRVQGRIVEEEALNHPAPDNSLLENVSNTLRRLESDEIPGARLELAFRGARRTVTTDDEGFFRVDFDADLPLEGGWHRVGVRLIDSVAGGSGVTATAEVRVPDPESELIVISDFDDTVIVTNVNNRVDMLRRVLGRNATTREPFPGVPAFYRALARGSSPTGNAIFYVSRTGWNFYDLAVGVLDRHDIPAGPMLMRDLALIESEAAALPTDAQKLGKIAEVIETFADQRFILIGDSGQADPSIYAECASRYGRRIAAVYIRKMKGREVKAETAGTLRSRAGSLCIAESTLEMARHAAANGFIAEDDIAGLEAESAQRTT